MNTLALLSMLPQRSYPRHTVATASRTSGSDKVRAHGGMTDALLLISHRLQRLVSMSEAIETPVSKRLASVKNVLIVLSGKGMPRA